MAAATKTPPAKGTKGKAKPATKGKATAAKSSTARGGSRRNGKASTTTKAQAPVEVKATTEHPEKRQALLKKAGLSVSSELSAEQVKRADSAEAKKIASARRLAEFIMRGSTGSNGKGSSTSKPKDGTPRRTGPRPDGKLTGIEAARKVLSKTKGITPVEAAHKMLALEPAPITGTYAQANAQKKVYDLIKAGEAKRDGDGKVTLA